MMRAATLMVLILVALSRPMAAQAQTARSALEIVTAEGRRHAFAVEVAATPDHLARGLMFRRSLAADEGMLFDFGQPQIVAMWMKNTLIPLDMLFLAADGRVINIAERTVPHSLDAHASAAPARAVLEIGGGIVQRLGIRPGDRVVHPVFGGR